MIYYKFYIQMVSLQSVLFHEFLIDLIDWNISHMDCIYKAFPQYELYNEFSEQLKL